MSQVFEHEMESFWTFISSARKLPLLSRSEEVELIAAAQVGDERAVRLLVLANARLILSIAVRWTRWGLPLQDLFQEGTVGLVPPPRNLL